MKELRKIKKVVDKRRKQRYSSVVKAMKGMGLPQYVIDRVKKLIAEDKKNLTMVKEDGKVFLVDKKTKEKV